MFLWYMKLCGGIYCLLKDKAKSDIPYFGTYMFTLFLFELIMFIVDSILSLALKEKSVFSHLILYVFLIIFALVNYVYVFKNKTFMKYYDKKAAFSSVILIIFFIFISSMALVLIVGQD